MKEEQVDFFYFEVQETVLKTKVDALQQKANAAQTLLHSVEFDWFGDQVIRGKLMG